MPPRKKTAVVEPTPLEKNLAAVDESAPGGRIKRSADEDFEYAADHQGGEPDGLTVVWNPYAAGFVIDRKVPEAPTAEGAVGGGIQLSPVVPQGDTEKNGTENVVEQQAHVDAVNTLPDQYSPGTPGVPEPEPEPKSAEPTA